MKYSPTKRAEIKKMFVIDGQSAKEISNFFDGKPSIQAIVNWSNRKNREGLSWREEREQYEIARFEEMSPGGLARKILEHINKLLQKSDFNVKDADALAKLRVSLERITDKKYQIPMMFELLTDFVKFLKKRYPKLATEELMNAIRHFKNRLLERLT